MKMRIRRLAAAATLLFAGLHCGQAAALDQVLAGDIITGVLPVVAFGTAWLKDDGQGEGEWFRDTVYSEVLVTSLRVAFGNSSIGRRPDGHKYGFPSGHAGFVFSQAGFLQERYGWKYGVPALVAASAVSWIRVNNDKHYWRDVLVGGALSYGVSLLTVTPYKATYLAPTIGPDWLGIRIERSF
jgi:membrane-associated phospholipid phosphatase